MTDQERAVMEQALEALEYDGLLKKRQAITALRAALAQKPEPVQEPVGEMRLSEIIDGMVVPAVPEELPVGTKLYAAPPQRPPLTDEEIAHEVYRKWGMLPGANSVITEFARAIERKVRGEA